jgi:hypothetical protein
MREVFIRTILLVPLYFLQPNIVTGNFQDFAQKHGTTPGSHVRALTAVAAKSKIPDPNTPVFRNVLTDIYPADVLTGVAYIYFMNNTTGKPRSAKGYLHPQEEQNNNSTMKSRVNPEKTTTMLFLLASIITLIGSAQLATKLQFNARDLRD